jgi:hypothetical protein
LSLQFRYVFPPVEKLPLLIAYVEAHDHGVIARRFEPDPQQATAASTNQAANRHSRPK